MKLPPSAAHAEWKLWNSFWRRDSPCHSMADADRSALKESGQIFSDVHVLDWLRSLELLTTSYNDTAKKKGGRKKRIQRIWVIRS